MSDHKVIAASIVHFLKQQVDDENFNVDARESLEVGIQCIETAFDLAPEDANRAIDLLNVFRNSKGTPTSEQAELLKTEGNDLMRSERFREALDKYNQAIQLDPKNAVYLCNRAAAHFKLERYDDSVADCMAALAIDPNYGKAYGRLGLALAGLSRHREARIAYARAVELDPDNISYQQNMRIAEQYVAHGTGGGDIDFSAVLQNPELMNMATQMLGNPNMQNMIHGLMNNTLAGRAGGGTGGMNAFLEIGQTIARQMQATNPELVEQLQRQMPPFPENEDPPNNP